MRIKKLEVLGFKSFLEKVSFQFEVPITAIVGPNGCGKSNVVDALKWVTGELSSKELRGKSMDDLIFAGSELRPPTSMMEVSLTLDNAEKIAPIAYADYPEINVLRRMFRDGTSEFYINKVECRLRDIIDLFLDTGIGESSYSIIEQGRVGAIISSRPEDKRLIIEEAAGITKYKSRKKSAERKMEFTKQNLLRVNDVLGELKRQIGSLERQAKKAEKYKNVRDEVKTLDLQILTRDFVMATQAQTDMKGLEEEANLQFLNLESKLAEQQNIYEEKRIAVTSVENDLKEKQATLFEQRTQIQALDNDITNYKKDILLSSDLAEKEKREAIALHETQVNLESRLTELEEQLQNMTSSQLGIDSEYVQAAAESAKAQELVASIESNLDSQKSELIKIAGSEGALTRQVEHHEAQIKSLTSQRDQKKHQLEQGLAEIKKLHAEVEEKGIKLKKTQQLRFEFEQNTNTTAEKLQETQAKRQALSQTLAEYSQKLEGLKSKQNTLNEFIKSYKGYDEAVRAIMAQKRDANAPLGSVKGLIADAVESKAGYEKAVQAALDQFLKCIVVENVEGIRQGIQFLEEHNRGQASFVALKQNHNINVDIPSIPEGILGSVSDFITQKNYETIPLNHLLRSIFVVASLEEGLGLWEKGHHISMVTLKGESIGAWGHVTGGKGKSERGVLEIKNEIADLEVTISQLTEEKVALNETLVVTDKEISLLKAQHAELQRNLEGYNHSSREFEKEHSRAQDQLSYQQKTLDHVQTDLSRIEADISRLTTESVQAKEELIVVHQKKETTEKERENLFVTLASAKTYMSQWFEKVSTIKVEKASLTERLTSLKREQITSSDLLSHTKQKQEVLLKSAQEHGEESLEKQEYLRTAEENRLVYIQQFEQDEEDFKKAKSVLDEELAYLQNLESGIKSFWHEKDTAGHALNDLRLKLQEEALKVSRVIEQVQERHYADVAAIVSAEDFILLPSDQVEQVKERLGSTRKTLEQLGDVNLGAIEELKEVRERFEFTTQQKDDLEKSLEGLTEAIKKLNATTTEKFAETFKAVDERFQYLFPRLFHGGKAKLLLTNPEDLLETGVDIVAQPPGKKLQNLNLLSGGEKALTAIALLFSIFQFKAPPFCVLDEVDAPLDDVNVGRFADIVKEMSAKTQFIVITHNKTTMEMSENLYGVTMSEPGVSRLVSVRVQNTMDAVAPRAKSSPDALSA